MQYCVDHPEEISKLSKVKAQVSEVKGVMMENIEKVLNRRENIELLVDKTENLRSQGVDVEKAAKTLHPCWAEYRICDERATAIYVNIFSGEATTQFPTAMEMARRAILADAMGLGKTVMTIALILARPGRGSSHDQKLVSETISVFVHYGGDRTNDSEVIAEHDVVLTTYGVLTAAYKKGDAFCTPEGQSEPLVAMGNNSSQSGSFCASQGQSQPSSTMGVTVYTSQGQSRPLFAMSSNYVEGHGHGHGHGVYISQSPPESQSQPPFAMGHTNVHHVMTSGQLCIETKEFGLVRNMLIAVVRKRYRDTAQWRDKLTPLKSKRNWA
ncbi:DNA repair protein RAD5B [Camellia lanceoleosa]|uniref:DNA repair protein RAD5B n=1 Tax=Camellia lanceoleosa TaxID=1840588 RepID=A0ACC0F8T1_9ERIC|nr:DNA repair protein RAD5B [Camellia lanceoleosa]